MRMVDVTAKPSTARSACARGTVQTLPEVVERIKSGTIAKGDVLGAARLAAIMATKRTPDLLPLCHPIALGSVEVELELEIDAIYIAVVVKNTDRTGVEMEALTAVSVAALCIIDMIKAVDPNASIEHVRVETKSGGKTGDWKRDETR